MAAAPMCGVRRLTIFHRDEHDEGDEDCGVARLPVPNSLDPLGGEGGSGGDELARRRRFVVDAHIDSVLSPAPYRSQQCRPPGPLPEVVCE